MGWLVSKVVKWANPALVSGASTLVSMTKSTFSRLRKFNYSFLSKRVTDILDHNSERQNKKHPVVGHPWLLVIQPQQITKTFCLSSSGRRQNQTEAATSESPHKGQIKRRQLYRVVQLGLKFDPKTYYEGRKIGISESNNTESVCRQSKE